MNKYIKMGLVGLAGGAAGYVYYHFWGCTSGCPLQSNWYVLTGYGALAGVILGMPVRKKADKSQAGGEGNDN